MQTSGALYVARSASGLRYMVVVLTAQLRLVFHTGRVTQNGDVLGLSDAGNESP